MQKQEEQSPEKDAMESGVIETEPPAAPDIVTEKEYSYYIDLTIK